MSILSPSDVRSAFPGVVIHQVLLEGAGASVPVVRDGGAGMTVTRTGVGTLRVVFRDPPGLFAGFFFGFGAATVANIAGHSCGHDLYVPATRTINLRITDGADAANDLAATEFLTLGFVFRDTSVRG